MHVCALGQTAAENGFPLTYLPIEGQGKPISTYTGMGDKYSTALLAFAVVDLHRR